MSINYKKAGLIVGFIILCIALGYGIFVLFFKPQLPTTTIKGDDIGQGTGDLPSAGEGEGTKIITGIDGELPSGGETDQTVIDDEIPADEKAQGGITKTTVISADTSIGATTDKSGSSVLYYNSEDGKFYKVDKNGQQQALSNKVFFNVQKVSWAPNKDKAILEYPDGANILYNFNTKKQATLPKHWEGFNFSPTSNQIVAKSIGLDPENRWLLTSNDDGSGATIIDAIGKNADKVIPSWSPNNLSIALFQESMDFDRQRIYFVGKNKENFKATIVNGRGFQHQWDSEGKKMLYSVYSSDTNLNPNLWIVDAQGESIGQNRKRLNLQTWAEKCNFSSDTTIYCAVPKTLPEGAGVFPQLAKQTSDNIYKVDLQTGTKQLISVPDNEYNIDNIIVSEDESNLYFTDSFAKQIHKIKLK